jgi:hypothetical protein
MSTRKVTIELPEELLQKAQRASRAGVTQTIRKALQILAASDAYERARKLRGTYRYTLTLEELKDDR